MKSKWKIDLKGFENYRFGEDKELYCLPKVDVSGKNRSLKKIAKCSIKKRWFINRNGVIERWSESQLRAHLVLDDNPIVLIKETNLPF